MAMRRNRRSSPAWKITKKALLVVTFIVGLRLAWLMMVRGLGPGGSVVEVQIKDDTLNDAQGWPADRKNEQVGSDQDFEDDNRYENSKNGYIENPDTGKDEDAKDLSFDENKPMEIKRIVAKSTTKLKPTKEQRLKTNEWITKNKPIPSSASNVGNIKATNNKFKNNNDNMQPGRLYDRNVNSSKTKEFDSNKLASTKGKETGANQAQRSGATDMRKVSQKVESKGKPIYKVGPDETCQETVPWGQPHHASVSTFDLAKLANYTTDEEGAYAIPIRKPVDIMKDPNLSHVNVILVPFSHADPGYGMTMEGYYVQKTKSTLDNMLLKLAKYSNMTFQWAETVFLARWFEDLHEEHKELTRRFIKRGQLEIVLGGWVMPDEASTHYVSVVDQLIEGHQWLIENLGVKPRNAWVNDPFGYSSTMPYLWKASGMNNLVFLRIDQAIKAVLMKRKSLDFMWRPYWKHDNSSDLLSTLMPYTNYWIADVCGPEPKVCNEFGFINQGYNQQVVEITAANVEKQSMKLYEQLRVTADLYKYNTLYVGLGEDFSFTRGEDWDNLYNNYEKIIQFFKSRKELKMNIKFGTLAEYFSNVRREEQRIVRESKTRQQSGDFQTLSGDFFPYTERKNEYWTGYFSTRPMNKRFSREIESLVRAADSFNVMAYSLFKYYGKEYSGYKSVTQNLRIARRELGMFLHHDGITGTSLPFVVEDFEVRLMKGYKAVNEAFKLVLSSLLSSGKSQTPKVLTDESSKVNQTAVVRKIVLNTTRDTKLVLINSLPRKRNQLVTVFVNSKSFEIETPSQPSLPLQITSLPETSQYVRVTFPVELPAFGVDVYHFRSGPKSSSQSKIEVNEQIVKVGAADSTDFSIRNDYLTVYFDAATGFMKKVTDKAGRSTVVAPKFYAYKASNSGAYLFGPAGPAELLPLDKVTVKVSRGTLMSEVKVMQNGIFHSIRLYNTTGLQGHSIFITNEIDMAAMNLKESEVILRFETDLKNGNNFYTDQNGYQMIGRENKASRKIEANYYPISTLAIIEDEAKRFNLHSKQPHGVASLKQGQLEVMLDRHTFRDDGRGLGQGYFQNVNVNSDFVLQIEYKTALRKIQEPRYTFPTQDSSLINEYLQNEIFLYSIQDDSKISLTKIRPVKTAQFPCDVSIVGMRNLAKNDLSYNGTSLVLHRKSYECGYQSVTKPCSGKENLTLKSLMPKLKADIVETSLSHLDNIKILDMNSNITPEQMELRAFRIEV